MPIPDLALLPTRTNVSRATGIPLNGSQQVAHNWSITPDQIEEDAVMLRFQALGTSVTAAAYTGLSPDKLSVIFTVTQGGTDQLVVEAEHPHTVIR